MMESGVEQAHTLNPQYLMDKKKIMPQVRGSAHCQFPKPGKAVEWL